MFKRPPYSNEDSNEDHSAWMPRRQTPGSDAKWPTLLLEVAFSEALPRLLIVAKWWFASSEGQVKIGVIMCIRRTQPWIVVEKWKLQRKPRPSHAALKESTKATYQAGNQDIEEDMEGTGNDDQKVPAKSQEIVITPGPNTTITTIAGGVALW